MTVSSFLGYARANADEDTELRWWLINAFNGEWSRIANASPKAQIDAKSVEK